MLPLLAVVEGDLGIMDGLCGVPLVLVVVTDAPNDQQETNPINIRGHIFVVGVCSNSLPHSLGALALDHVVDLLVEFHQL